MDTLVDYMYDVNYSVQKGECLKLGMWLPFSYCMEYDEDYIVASNTIPFEMESVDIAGEGRIYHTSTSGFKYDCYLKDHLGSTRMVVNDENVVTEAFAYQPYGTIIPLEDIAATPQTPTRQQFTGKEFDEDGYDQTLGIQGMNLYYFGSRYYDPEIGIWLAVDPVDRMWTPYSYCGNNPVIFIDPNGEDFGISAAVIIIGAVIGAYTTTSAVEGTYNPGDWKWDGTTAGALVGGAVIGGVSAGVGSAVTSGVTGAVGIATSSGLGGAIAGGAAGGVVGGAIGYTGSYAMQLGLTDKTWDTGEFFGGLGLSVAGGGILGGLGGAIAYGLNPNAVNQEIIKWGYGHDKFQGTLDFVAKEYNIAGKFTYESFPGDVRIPETARGYTPSPSESYIYNEAFRINGKFDASSVIQTMSHEGFHQSMFVANTTGSRMFAHVNEFYAYQHNLLNSARQGLSTAVRDYSYRQFMLNAIKTPIKYMFLR